MSMLLAMGLWCRDRDFIMLRYIPYITTLLRVFSFNQKWALIFVKAFSVSYCLLCRCWAILQSVQLLSPVRLLQLHGLQHSRLLVHHQLLELAHMSIKLDNQPSHPLSSPSPAFNLSQQQGLFQWVSSSHQVAKVVELQHQSFQWIFRTDLL